MEKIISYCGYKTKVNCDENCNKAWGINSRPRVYPSIDTKVYGLDGESNYPDNYDDEDFFYLSDAELGDAPIDPGTYEGSDAKPQDLVDVPNKWCVRECERCNSSRIGESELPLKLRTFDISSEQRFADNKIK